MGLFSSSMTPEQLAQARQKAKTAGQVRKLAQAANGHGVTRAEKEKANKQLEQMYGKRGAARLKEAELRSAGAQPRGLGRFFG
ncbi:hypothetical protein [Thermoactinospora rubra]|uniref:hypothetical protein n=1 Tax=Thermoactinospora rubra TaxID=1088767 RepID=UPI000A11494B|nr:hypothetical protein [Thermoactinospora rubra]